MGVAFTPWRHRIPEGVSLEPLDRFVGRDGTLVTADMVTGIDLRIYELPIVLPVFERLDEPPGDGTTGPWFDTLQTDGRWTRSEAALDRRGYNHRQLITQTDLDYPIKSGSIYRLEIIVHTEPWEDLVSVHEYTVERIFSMT
jgi:hypothetical protein